MRALAQSVSRDLNPTFSLQVFRAAERAAAAEREAAEAEQRKKKEEEEALERVVVHDTPRVPRPYTSVSAAETETSVRYMSVTRSRPLVTVRIQRRLALFGGRSGLHDRTGEALAVDIRPRKDPGYDGVRKENSVCFQAGGSAVAVRVNGAAQTTRHVPSAFSCLANLDDPDDSAFSVLAHAINLDEPMEMLVEGGPRVLILRTDPAEEEEPPASDRDLVALVAATLATASALESGGADPSHRSGGVGGKPGVRAGKGAKGVRGPLQRLQDFLKAALPITEQALSQNETLNIYANELASMAEEGQGSTLGSSGGEGSTLREERQFMDLTLTANNALPAVEWHPRHPSWLAVASAPLLSWEARLADAAVPRTSHILLFTTAEFTAQAVLDAPADVTCLAWHPTDPGWLAAGLVTGGVLVFDLGGAAALARAGGGGKEGEGKSLKHISPKSVTAVESSHSGAVVALRWLPPTHHISHRGALAEDKELGASGHSAQLMSVGSEGGVYVWDTRFREKDKEKPKVGGVSTRRKSVTENGVSFLVSPLVPGAAAAGVLTPPPEHPWVPVFRTAFKLNGRNAAIATVSFPWSPSAPSAVPTDPLLLSTMDGRTVAMDWTPGAEGTCTSAWLAMTAAQAGAAPAAASKGGDDDDGPSSGSGGGGGGSGGNRVLFLSSESTDSPSPLVARCPTMPDVVLVLRAFSWALLKAGEPRPLLVSPPTTSAYTTGAWSPTRPGVVFLGRMDGALETWDIGDSTTHPASVTPLVSSALTCLQFRGATGPPVAGAGPGAKQSIAVGDAKGSLHVLDVPPPLRRGPATEEALLRALLSRESTRVGYVARRGVEREGERTRKEAAAVAAAAKREAAATVLESELAGMCSSVG